MQAAPRAGYTLREQFEFGTAENIVVAGAGNRAALEWILHGDSLPAARVAVAEWHLERAAIPGR